MIVCVEQSSFPLGETKHPKIKRRVTNMLHTLNLISFSLLTLAFANSPAVGSISEKVNTPDRVNGVRNLFLGDQDARPDNPALRITRSVIDHIDDRLMDHHKPAAVAMKPSKEMKQMAPRAASRSRHRAWVTNAECRIADFKTPQGCGPNKGHFSR
jgi:hypothetical protein